MRPRSVSSIAVILTLIALCFSVGEGLRLRPFPVPQSAEPDTTNGSSVDSSSGLAVFKSGPLDVPTQLQKRSKRFAVDFSGAVSRYAYKPFPGISQFPVRETTAAASIGPAASFSGRAPPSIS